MYEGNSLKDVAISAGLGRYNGAQQAGTTVPRAESLPAALEETLKLAGELRNMCGMAADNLAGGHPEEPNCKAPSSGAILDRVNEIRHTLREAIGRQGRVMETLAL